jgi:hypothetical protein
MIVQPVEASSQKLVGATLASYFERFSRKFLVAFEIGFYLIRQISDAYIFYRRYILGIT